jgi:hypothetical protein
VPGAASRAATVCRAVAFARSGSASAATASPTTSSLSGPSSRLAWAVNAGGTIAGIAPWAISPDSASIFGPFAPMIVG